MRALALVSAVALVACQPQPLPIWGMEYRAIGPTTRSLEHARAICEPRASLARQHAMQVQDVITPPDTGWVGIRHQTIDIAGSNASASVMAACMADLGYVGERVCRQNCGG